MQAVIQSKPNQLINHSISLIVTRSSIKSSGWIDWNAGEDGQTDVSNGQTLEWREFPLCRILNEPFIPTLIRVWTKILLLRNTQRNLNSQIRHHLTCCNVVLQFHEIWSDDSCVWEIFIQFLTDEFSFIMLKSRIRLERLTRKLERQ